MYVRRWPRISASSRIPPRDIRTNSRFSDRAIDSPIDVFPVPGGPIRVRIAPDFLSALDAALLAQLAHGDVLDDAILHVLEARVIGIEHLAARLRIEPLLGSGSPTAPRAASPGSCGSSATLANCSPMRSKPAQLALRLLADVVWHVRLGDLPVGTPRRRTSRPRRVLADRLELPPQHILALLLLHARVHVLADPAANLQLSASRSRCRPRASSRRSATSIVSSSCTFCSKVRSGE